MLQINLDVCHIERLGVLVEKGQGVDETRGADFAGRENLLRQGIVVIGVDRQEIHCVGGTIANLHGGAGSETKFDVGMVL